MANINIQDGIISSSADYSLYHGTTKVADVEQDAIRVQGDIIAENYIVSSSVTYMTQSFSSGSTVFGDTSDDTHQFTGSLSITGSSIQGVVGGYQTGLTSIVAYPGTGSAYGLHIADKNYGIRIDRTSGGNASARANIYVTGGDWLSMKMNGGDTNGIAVDKIGAGTGGINPANNYIHFNGYTKEYYGYYQGSRIYETHDASGILIHLVHDDTFNVSGSLIQFTPHTGSAVDVQGTLTTTGNVSGSATSTGSFGDVFVSRRLLVGTAGGTDKSTGTIRVNMPYNHPSGALDIKSYGDSYFLQARHENNDGRFYLKSDNYRMQFYSEPRPDFDSGTNSAFYFLANM